MAQRKRRSISSKVTDDGIFLNMPLTAQGLYFTLIMHADDEGFINDAMVSTIKRMTRASDEDFNVLVEQRFVLHFPSGVNVIRHWKVHYENKKDRFTPTMYTQERSMLEVDPFGAYELHA